MRISVTSSHLDKHAKHSQMHFYHATYILSKIVHKQDDHKACIAMSMSDKSAFTL